MKLYLRIQTILLFITIFLFYSSAFHTMAQSNGENSFEIIGTIRNTGTGWFAINDTGHQPLNIADVKTINGDSIHGYVIVTFNKTANKIGTLLIVPDETYAQTGIIAGASVNMNEARIKFGKNGIARSPNSVSSQWGNFWIYGKMFGAYDGQ